PCESSRSGSRRLHAGHHLANTRAPARLILDQPQTSSSDVTCSLTTPQQRFTCVRLPDPHLTPLTAPFPHRSPRRSSANAACVGLKPPPAGRLRRAYLHHSRSTAFQKAPTYIPHLSSCARGTPTSRRYPPTRGSFISLPPL